MDQINHPNPNSDSAVSTVGATEDNTITDTRHSHNGVESNNNRPQAISRHTSLPEPNNSKMMNNLHYQFLTSNSRSVSTSASTSNSSSITGSGSVPSLSASLTLSDDLS